MEQPTELENTPPVEEIVDPKAELDLKKAQIQLLEAELSDIDAKLDSDFLEAITGMLSEDEMDMRLDDDIRPFLSLVEEKREGFYREKLNELKGRIDGMKSEVADTEENMSIEDAKAQFLGAHPEVDFAALTDFYHNDLTPRQKEELYAAPDYLAMLEAAFAMYSKKNKGAKPAAKADEGVEDDVLPPDLNNVPSQAPVGDPSPAAKDEGYLARIGVRR